MLRGVRISYYRIVLSGAITSAAWIVGEKEGPGVNSRLPIEAA
jgi:hypothetical protein